MTLKTKYANSHFKPWKETVLAKVKEKNNRSKQTKPVLSDSDFKKHLEKLHLKFIIASIDEAANNFACICRNYYISKLLADVSPNKNENSTSTYSQTQKFEEEIVKTNIKYCRRFDLKITEQDKTLPIIYWLPKLHKTPIDVRFKVASKKLQC